MTRSHRKKGISAHQTHRQLWTDEHPGAYKSAWFMVHRIREAMNDKEPGILTGIVEATKPTSAAKHRRGAPGGLHKFLAKWHWPQGPRLPEVRA